MLTMSGGTSEFKLLDDDQTVDLALHQTVEYNDILNFTRHNGFTNVAVSDGKPIRLRGKLQRVQELQRLYLARSNDENNDSAIVNKHTENEPQPEVKQAEGKRDNCGQAAKSPTSTRRSDTCPRCEHDLTKPYTGPMYVLPSNTPSNANGDDCSICSDVLTKPKRLRCGHEFCTRCIDKWFVSKPTCPVCGQAHGVIKGTQPDGTMTDKQLDKDLPGFPPLSGTIEITYSFPNGIQEEHHPAPGQPYRGIRRVAYLPNNREGRDIHALLKRAFTNRLIFTVGRSVTTGKEGQITWNDIHHKTSIHGGPARFGYPDDGYLKRVKEELGAKGIR